MGWFLNITGCLLAIVAVAHSAVITTEDTLVVAKTEESIVTNVDTTETVTEETEVTTSEPSPEIKLTEMDIESNIHMRYAHTAVVTHMRNPAIYAQEASFRVLLPESAFISGFTMSLDGKVYKAFVKKKEEAKEMFSEAVSRGVAAAHIATKARDSNHFTVSVNLEAKKSVIFNLTYEELLVRRNNVYNHAINLHPGTLVPKLKVTVNIRESENITTLRVPEVRSGNEIDATENDAQNTKAVIQRDSLDANKATITFNPDIEEQLRLQDVYAVKSQESRERKQNGVLGQFVVQYDIDRTNDNEFLMSDGYFVHFFAPTALPPLNKYVVFVFDTSGSMSWGEKIDKLREAMDIILSELNPGDFFSIVEFNSEAKVHNLNEEIPTGRRYHSYYNDQHYNKGEEIIAPSPATPENIVKAKRIVSKLYASGGTNIMEALNLALDLIQRNWPQQTAAAISTSTNDTSADVSQNQLKKDVIQDSHYLEPIIIFLTDGQAGNGDAIIQHITERNSGVENKAIIFSLAFGSDADIKFLRQLSLRNDGFMKYIYVASDTALQLRDFYRQVSSPVLAGVRFIYPPEQVAEGSLTKHSYRTYYSGSEVVVAGRMADNNTDLRPSVRGFYNVDSERKLYEKWSTCQSSGLNLPLERLWAYLTIKQLLDKHDAADNRVKDEDPEKKALDLALKYEFVTRLTSLVVVKPNATTAVDAEAVNKEKEEPTVHSARPSAIHYKSKMRHAGGGSYFRSSGSSRSSARKHSFAQQDSFSYRARGSSSTQYLISPRLSGSSSGIRYAHSSGRSNNAWAHRYIGSGSNIDYTGRNRMYNHSLQTKSDSSEESDESQEQKKPIESNTANTIALKEFHLENCSWLLSILVNGTDKIHINFNGAITELELSRNTTAPKESGGDDTCTYPVRTNGIHRRGNGKCVYLSRCDSTKKLTAGAYGQHFCSINNKYAGVCCQRIDIIETNDSNEFD